MDGEYDTSLAEEQRPRTPKRNCVKNGGPHFSHLGLGVRLRLQRILSSQICRCDHFMEAACPGCEGRFDSEEKTCFSR